MAGDWVSRIAVYEWDERRGEHRVLTMRARFKDEEPHSDSETHVLPGGKRKRGEKHPVDTAKRELEEETGLKAKKGARIIPLSRDRARRHVKYNYAIPREDCEGPLRLEELEENRCILEQPYFRREVDARRKLCAAHQPLLDLLPSK